MDKIKIRSNSKFKTIMSFQDFRLALKSEEFRNKNGLNTVHAS